MMSTRDVKLKETKRDMQRDKYPRNRLRNGIETDRIVQCLLHVWIRRESHRQKKERTKMETRLYMRTVRM